LYREITTKPWRGAVSLTDNILPIIPPLHAIERRDGYLRKVWGLMRRVHRRKDTFVYDLWYSPVAVVVEQWRPDNGGLVALALI
jgi:hypothetical protein